MSEEFVIQGKKVCIICFPDLAHPLAESIFYMGASLIDIQPHTNVPFPRDYDTYIVHLSNVHGPNNKFDPEILKKLRADNPRSKIYAFSGGDFERNAVRDFVTETRDSKDLVSFMNDLK